MPLRPPRTSTRRARWTGPVAVLALVVLLGVVRPSSVDAQLLAAPGSAQGSPPTNYQPVTPARLLDTRAGSSTIDGQSLGGGKVGPGQSVTVTVAGRGGVPATGWGAVVLNITGVAPTAATWITAYPAGTAPPTASNLNLAPGETRPNAVIIGLGAGGALTLANAAGSVDLVVDVMGWFPHDNGLVGVQPARLLDTRSGQATIDGTNSGGGTFGAGTVRHLKVAGRGGVPTTGAAAVVLNLTATSPTTSSWLTMFPTGQPQPVASNLNMTPGQTVANLVVAPVGSDGRVSIANARGSTHVVVDVLGWLPDVMDFTGLAPARLADTRGGMTTIDGLFAGLGRVFGGSRLTLPVTGRAAIPSTGVAAVILNVTATDALADTYLTVFAGGAERPFASNLNVRPGATAPNLVIAPVGPDGTVEIYNASGAVHVVVDVLGWMGAEVVVDPPVDPEDPVVPGSDPTVAVPGQLQDLALSPDGDTAYVTDIAPPAIEIVDVAHRSRIGTIPLPAAPSSIDISPDGDTVYATIPDTKQLAVVDVSGIVLSPVLPIPRLVTVPVAPGNDHRPKQVAVAADGSALVVLEALCSCNDWYGALQRYHPETNSFVEEAGLPPGGTMTSHAAASHDRTKIAIATWDAMSVLDVTTGEWVYGRSSLAGWATLAGDGDGDTWMGGGAFFDDLPLRLGQLPNWAMASALNDGGDLAYGVLAPELDTDPWVTVVETDHFRSIGRIALPDATTRAGQMALTPDGDELVLATAHGVSIVDTDPDLDPVPLTAPNEDATVPVEGRIEQLATDPDGLTLYATNSEANEVDVISLVTHAVVDRIPVGSMPDGLDLSDDASMLYVVNAGGSDVSAVDLETGEEVARTPLFMFYDNYPYELASVWGHDIAVAGDDAFVTTDGLIAHHVDLTTFEANQIRYGTPESNLFSPTEAEASEDKSIIAFHEYARGSEVITWDNARDELVAKPATGFGSSGLALTPNGSLIAADQVVARPDGRILGTSPTTAAMGGGIAIARDGSRVYKLVGDVITVVETAHFRHLGNIPLPTRVPSGVYHFDLVLTRDGGWLATPAGSGVTIVGRNGVIPLDEPAAPTSSSTIPMEGPIGGVVINPTSQIAYVSRPERNLVEVVSLSLERSVGQILVGSFPTDLDLSADGRHLYVVNTGADDVSVVDTTTRLEVGRLPVPRDALERPWAIAVAGNDRAIVYLGRYDTRVYVIDLATGDGSRVPFSVVPDWTTPQEPQASGDHSKVFLAGVGEPFSSSTEIGAVAVFDATSRTWSRRVTGASLWQPVTGDRTGSRWIAGSSVIGGDLHRQGTLDYPYRSGDFGPWGVALRSDGAVAYQLGQGRVDVIELDHFRRTHTIPTPENPELPWAPSYPFDTALGDLVLSPDNSTLVSVSSHGLSIMRTADAAPLVVPKLTGQADVLLPTSLDDIVIDQAGAIVYGAAADDNTIVVIDVARRKLVANIRVGSQPTALDLSADGTRLYAVNHGSGGVSVIDTATRHELRRVELPEVAYGKRVTSIAVAADGVAFLGVEGKPFLLRMDLVTEQITLLTPPVTAGHDQFSGTVRSSVDKSTIAALGPAQNDELLGRYDAGTSTWLRAAPVAGGFFQQPALDRTGNRIAFGNVVVDRSLHQLSVQTELTNWKTVLSPDGSRLYRIDGVKLHEFSPTTGQRVRRYILPSYVDSQLWYGRAAAFTNDGQTIILVGGGGVMILPLADIYEIDEAYEP